MFWCSVLNTDVYISGSTKSASGIATSGAYKTTVQNTDIFIARFSAGGKCRWSTYYGGPGQENHGDRNAIHGSLIYVAGTSNSKTGIATPNAYRDTVYGNYDGFVTEFDTSGSRVWGSYLGGEGYDGVHAVAVETDGSFYACGTSASKTGVAVAGTHQTTYGGGTYDAFLARFSAFSVDAGPLLSAPGLNVCKGKYPVQVRIKNYGGIPFDSARIGWSMNGNLQNTALWIDSLKPGDTSALIMLDTMDFVSGVYDLKFWVSLPRVKDENQSNDTLLATVIVNPHPQASFSVGDGCAGDSLPFESTSTISPGTIVGYNWNFGDGNFTVTKAPRHVYVQAGNYQVRLVARSDKGCRDTLVKTITIYAYPDASFSFQVSGDTATFQPVDTTQSAYHWSFGDGDTSAVPTPSHTYTQAGKYVARLTVENSAGCISETPDTVTITTGGFANENGATSHWRIYPNPVTSGFLTIAAGDEEAELRIYDILGRCVIRQHLAAGKNDIISLSREDFPPGIYQVWIQSAGHKKVAALLVK